MKSNARGCFVAAFISAVALSPGSLSAQAAAPAANDSIVAVGQGPEVQVINSASALSTEPLGSLGFVRELPDGRVLVNDGNRRRLLLMDTTLTNVTVVLDSLTDVANSYGTRAGILIPFSGDSTLFVDPNSLAVLVLDPSGRLVRTRAVWRTEHLSAFTNTTGTAGVPGIDSHGRIVYRIPAQTAPPAVAPPPGVPYIAPPPDSAFIVAVDLRTRVVDTLAVVRIPKQLVSIRQRADGQLSLDQTINPLPVSDDWTMLADGRVAVIRAIDYRVEYLERDGSWSSSPKQPYQWRRLDDAAKEAMVDSVKTGQERAQMNSYTTAMIRWVNMYRQNYLEGFAAPEGYVPATGFPQAWKMPPNVTFPTNYVYGCPVGVEPTMLPGPAGAPAGASAPAAGSAVAGAAVAGAAVAVAAAPGAAGAGAPAGVPSCIPQPTPPTGQVPLAPARPNVLVVDADELPDYRPPFASSSSARGDADGNLWIRPLPAQTVPGGPIYDVIDPQGTMIARYQIPAGYTIVGFGKGKVVYMSMRDTGGLRLARVRLR